MTITYEKHGDYYIFSHKPKVRVYLGEALPEDYIWDELEQRKRSASCYHYVIATGEKVDDYPDGEIAGSASATVDYKCDYEFTRRISGMCSMGNFSTGVGVEYASKDKAMKRLAEAHYFNKTLDQYDAQQDEYRLKREEDKHRHPLLHNLMMVNGETYYVNDDGKRITFEEHYEFMKAGGYIK